jgi:hypothetical protein
MRALARADPATQASMMLRFQGQVGNAAVARAVSRQAADAAPAAATAAADPAASAGGDAPSDSSARMNALIAKIEHLHESVAQVAAAEQDEDAEQPLTEVAAGLAQLRAVASGTDEQLKLAVLAAFTTERLAQHEQEVGAGPASGAASSPQAPVSEQVAAPAAATPTVATKRLARAATPARRRMLSRQGEAVLAAGWAILAVDAEAAPAEAAAGPPGWAIGLGLAVVGAAVIGVGYVMMASQGNVADTGIVNEVNALIAAGLAATMCEALQQLMDAASRARDTARMQKIKATQKAKGCRHSRHS